MKNKRIYIVVAIVILIGIAYRMYSDYFSYTGIYRNITTLNGYSINEVEKPIAFNAFIRPEWIPKGGNEVNNLNIEISKVRNISIILESVMNRKNDIYFNFNSKPILKYNHGFFLSNAVIHADGSATSYNLIDSFKIQNNGQTFNVGQRGYGPDAKFSFGIEKENINRIKDGFTLEFKGYILYEYSKN